MRFSSLPKNGPSSRIWAYGFCSFHFEYNSQQYWSKKRTLPNDASKCFYQHIGLHKQKRSILFLKLVLIFSCSLNLHIRLLRFSSLEFLATKARRQERSRIEKNNAASLQSCFMLSFDLHEYFRIQGHWSQCRDARPVTTENISFSPAFITRKLWLYL